MPLSKEKQASYQKERRGKLKSVIPKEDSVIPKSYFKDGVEMVPPLMVEGAEGRMYQALPERPHFLTLSDGQILDRDKVVEHRPLSGVEIKAIKLANEGAFNFKSNNPALLQST